MLRLFHFSYIITILSLLQNASPINGESRLRGKGEDKNMIDGNTFGFPDVSCFVQMWNSDDPANECSTVKDKSGNTCIWCEGTSAMFSQAGACVSPSQVEYIDGNGLSCITIIQTK